MIHAHLASDRAVHLRQQGRRHLREGEAAQETRGRETRAVAKDFRRRRPRCRCRDPRRAEGTRRRSSRRSSVSCAARRPARARPARRAAMPARGRRTGATRPGWRRGCAGAESLRRRVLRQARPAGLRRCESHKARAESRRRSRWWTRGGCGVRARAEATGRIALSVPSGRFPRHRRRHRRSPSRHRSRGATDTFSS